MEVRTFGFSSTVGLRLTPQAVVEVLTDLVRTGEIGSRFEGNVSSWRADPLAALPACTAMALLVLAEQPNEA